MLRLGHSFIPAAQRDEMLHERLPSGRPHARQAGGRPGLARHSDMRAYPGSQIFARAPAVADAAAQSMFAAAAGAWNFTRPRTAVSVAV